MASPAAAFAQIASECEKDGLSVKNGERIGTELAKTFNVHPDEVGILRLEKSNLIFVYPARLHTVGSIPLTTTTSVAARSATSKRAEIFNNFAQTKHTSIFESVNLAGAKGSYSKEDMQEHVIQKLMSVPVLGKDGAVGVIEICRKGVSAPASGGDFTPADVQKLVAIAAALSKCFK